MAWYKGKDSCNMQRAFSELRSLLSRSDGSGEVIKVGPRVTRFTVGQRVSPVFHGTHLYGTLSAQNTPSQLGTFHDGALRQYAVFNEQACVEIPDHLSYREAATFPALP